MHDECAVREFRDVQRGGDLVSFGILYRAGPEEDVVGRVFEELDEIWGEQGLANEWGGIVVFGGEEDDEQVFEIAFRDIEGMGVAFFMEGESAVGDAIFLLELAVESSCSVARVEWSPSGVSRGL